MYAVIETSGRQYRVELGSEIELDQLDAEPGSTIELGRVLLVADGDDAHIGQPVVEGARVTGEIVRQDRGDKIVVFKYRPKARRRVKHGHRAQLTIVRVADIELNGRSAAKEADAQAKQQASERAAAEKEAQRKAAADKALADRLAAEQEAQAEKEAEAGRAAEKKQSSRRSATARGRAKAKSDEPEAASEEAESTGDEAGATAKAESNATDDEPKGKAKAGRSRGKAGADEQKDE
jgi:large subunit ribosomal protein L21